MQTSLLRTRPARTLILMLATGSLGSYVAMVSCSRTSERTYAPATKSALPAVPRQATPKPATPTPAPPPPAPARVYGPATKAAFIDLPPPQPAPQAAPVQQAAPAAQAGTP